MRKTLPVRGFPIMIGVLACNPGPRGLWWIAPREGLFHRVAGIAVDHGRYHIQGGGLSSPRGDTRSLRSVDLTPILEERGQGQCVVKSPDTHEAGEE